MRRWGVWLGEAVEDPDGLWRGDAPEDLVRWLVEKNFIVYNMHYREPQLWIGQSPRRDLELGIRSLADTDERRLGGL